MTEDDQDQERYILDPNSGKKLHPDRITFDHLTAIRDVLTEERIEDAGGTAKECDYHQGPVPADISKKLPNKCRQCFFCRVEKEGEKLEEEYGADHPDIEGFYWKAHIMVTSVLHAMGVLDFETDAPIGKNLELPGRDF